jgi:hypothetical protein
MRHLMNQRAFHLLLFLTGDRKKDLPPSEVNMAAPQMIVRLIDPATKVVDDVNAVVFKAPVKEPLVEAVERQIIICSQRGIR